MGVLLEKIGDHPINTEYGQFHLTGFSYGTSEQIVFCLIKKDITATIPLVRVQYGCIHGSVFRSIDCDCGYQMDISLRLISESGNGVFIYFPDHEGTGVGLKKKIQLLQLEIKNGITPKKAASELGIRIDDSSPLRIVPQLLAMSGVEAKVRLLGDNTLKHNVLIQAGLEIVDVISIMASEELLSDIAIREYTDKYNSKAVFSVKAKSIFCT